NGTIQVIVRLRPQLQRDKKNVYFEADSANGTVTAVPPTEEQSKQKSQTRKFFFDHVIEPNVQSLHIGKSDQERLYDLVGRPLLDHNFEGYNSCIFAYGQTGSGKSHTMTGSNHDEGLIPKTCQDLFYRIQYLQKSDVLSHVYCSYFEIYNEQIRDLLSDGTKSALKVRESPAEGIHVKGLKEFHVESYSQVKALLDQGNRARVTAATNMNDTSSRSHAVLTLKLHQTRYIPETDETSETISNIRMVDLAGSERATSTGTTGIRLREGGNINKSLTTLGRVIVALSKNELKKNPNQRKELIPYRDSILTWVLKENLGGNSKTAMIACLSPTDYFEGMSTLRYADQAKRIRTRAIVNQGPLSSQEANKVIEELQAQISILEKSMSTLKHSAERNHSENSQNGEQTQKLEVLKSSLSFLELKISIEENIKKSLRNENQHLKEHNQIL
ncbi:hypothetical protein CANCADRAFT_13262, partial [Tortispora caseinolytica NRRL Y-17796]